MSALQSFGDVLEGRVEETYWCPEEETPRVATQRRLDRLVGQEWPELPYAMMRMAVARKTQCGQRFYWRDLSVQYGDIELSLIGSPSKDATSTYTAIYSREDHSEESFRHGFLVPLHPSLEEDQLGWSAPNICDTANLTSEELAEVLLAKLVTFNASDFSQPAPFEKSASRG